MGGRANDCGRRERAGSLPGLCALLAAASACQVLDTEIAIQDDPLNGRPCFEPGRIADVDGSQCVCQAEGTWVCAPTTADVLSPVDSGRESKDVRSPDVSADASVEADARVDEYAVDAEAGVNQREPSMDVLTAESTEDSPIDGTLPGRRRGHDAFRRGAG